MCEPHDIAHVRETIVDDEHLRMLSIGYYISSGMSLLFSLFGGIYMLMGLMFTAVFRNAPPSQPNQAPPSELGWIFFGIGALIFSFMVAIAAMKFMVARRIKARSSRTFCLVVAGITCLGIPYGTALGVLTFIVLSRESIRARFTPVQVA